MTSRAKQKDTEADRQLYACLNASPPKSFLMVAGAGSGKTTSLIKGLTEILSKHGKRLKLRRQRVACITYTEVAAQEIWADVGNNPLVHVATIHSFMWELVRSFQSDIKQWVANRIDERLRSLQEAAAGFGPRVQQRTRDKNASDVVRYQQMKGKIDALSSFTYGTGSDYARGVLGHDDIIKMVPQLISERPLMRTLLAQQYPFLFVDESQDTAENVVSALKLVDQDQANRFCLGFFGDPMQRIYPTGIGAIDANPGWENITKPENFRCPTTVLKVANAIRQDGDGLVQTGGRTIDRDGARESVEGSAEIFILPISEHRDEHIKQVRAWMANRAGDPAWLSDDTESGVKLLVIVHRMAATRLGFGDLYAALNDKAPDSFKNGFLDGTAWPVRPFARFVLPLVSAGKLQDEFGIMQVLRDQSPLIKRDSLKGVAVADLLISLRGFTLKLQEMMEPGSGATNEDVLRLINDNKIVELDPRILSYLALREQNHAVANQARPRDDEDDGEEVTKEVAAMEAFLNCPASQFWGYYDYVNESSPFSTQQGIKGAEFERVLVVLDDDEGTHVQFSYEKYLGIKPLSDREESNRREGKETTIERTRRLLYVCCTRALKDLAVVFFTTDVERAKRQVLGLELFPAESIHGEEDLTAE
ncbi:UvrD-helicase domain-containing protein [Bradyrhizobium symbiodeficiens]|uniref:UvrD-helicase domain-containing protein n=1 Tax=Bradyrhizobium symbiodeficiens TaxID=1404367 RepID=UPI0030D07266